VADPSSDSKPWAEVRLSPDRWREIIAGTEEAKRVAKALTKEGHPLAGRLQAALMKMGFW
jgi:hypothetical protein